MLVRRSLLLRAPDDGGEAGGSSASEEESGSETPVEPASTGPNPVPYTVFKKTNAELSSAKKALDAAESKLSGFDGWTSPDDLQTALKAEQYKGKQALLLADNGVDPQYREYMLTRLAATNPDDPAGWLVELQTSEPAFFRKEGSSEASVQQPKIPPRQTPDESARTKPPGTGKAVTPADIDAMSVGEYSAWKKGGGLARLTAASG